MKPEIQQLLQEYRSGSGRLVKAVELIAPNVLHKPTEMGGWTIHQIVCHLSDSEALFADRMKRVLAEEKPVLPSADPDRFMQVLAQLSRTLDVELQLFQAVRLQMATILESQPDMVWQRTGMHTVAGEQTLLQLLQKAVNHLHHHLTYLEQKRKLLEQNNVTVRLLQPNEITAFANVAEDVFDNPVNPEWAAEFLGDPRHHLAVAITNGAIVGMASAVHYIHPDKPPELWINEVGVSSPFQNRGIGKQLLHQLFAKGKELGCATAWVSTETSNQIARKLYQSVGGIESEEPFVMVSFKLI